MSTKKASDDARDPRVDDYIAKAAPFAQAPLTFVREAMHAALPDVTEAIKWSHPFYLLDGRPFASMAAFKAHCSLGFWKGGRPVAEAAAGPRDKAMGQFGRIGSLADLPSAAALRKSKAQLLRLEREGVTGLRGDEEAEEAFFEPDAAEGMRAFLERRAPRFP